MSGNAVGAHKAAMSRRGEDLGLTVFDLSVLAATFGFESVDEFEAFATHQLAKARVE